MSRNIYLCNTRKFLFSRFMRADVIKLISKFGDYNIESNVNKLLITCIPENSGENIGKN